MADAPSRSRGNENGFETSVAVGVQSTRCHRLVAPYDLACTQFVLGAGVSHNRQAAITPKLPLRSESMRSASGSDDLRCTNRTYLWNCSQQLDRSVQMAFGKDSRLGLLPEFTNM